MMQIISVILITISILIIIYAINDFLRNININNDIEVKTKLSKMKIRMVVAICIFVVPFVLNFVVGLFSNVSKVFALEDEKLVEIDNDYLDSSYVWNEEKKYYENTEKEEVVEVINVNDENTHDKKEVKNGKEKIVDVAYDNRELVFVESDKKEELNVDDEVIEESNIYINNNEIVNEDNIVVNNKVSEDVVITDKDISNNKVAVSNTNKNSDRVLSNKKEKILNLEDLLKEEEVVIEDNKINHNSNNIVVNNANDLIVNNQPKKESFSEFTYYNQCDSKWQVRGFCASGYSMCSNGCGATAIAMIASTLGKNKSVTPLDVRDYLCNNNLHSNGGMAYAPFTNSGLLNYYGLNGNVIINYNDNSKYNDSKALAIKAEVDNGNGVILLIPGHYVVLGKNKTCNVNQVYMYDPASRADSGCYTMGELWTKTWNRYNRCYNKKKCGWRMAWSYKGIEG